MFPALAYRATTELAERSANRLGRTKSTSLGRTSSFSTSSSGLDLEAEAELEARLLAERAATEARINAQATAEVNQIAAVAWLLVNFSLSFLAVECSLFPANKRHVTCTNSSPVTKTNVSLSLSLSFCPPFRTRTTLLPRG